MCVRHSLVCLALNVISVSLQPTRQLILDSCSVVARRATRNVRENSCSGLMPVNRAALIGGPGRYEGMCFGGRGVEGRIVSGAGYRGGRMLLE